MSKIAASHILLKHTGSRNPVSRRDQSVVVRSPEGALSEIDALRETLTPENFPEVAKGVSECASYRAKGSLGEFGRGVMDPAFEKAAFALTVGEISEPVDSASGVHLIYRTA
eukprot:Trichotokara_eunicae@DN2920_c0_g1_i1.p1